MTNVCLSQNFKHHMKQSSSSKNISGRIYIFSAKRFICETLFSQEISIFQWFSIFIASLAISYREERDPRWNDSMSVFSIVLNMKSLQCSNL